MANWRTLFNPWILARGQEYFDCGQVEGPVEDGAYHPLLHLYEEESLPKAIELVREKRKQDNTAWSIINYTKALLGLLEKAGEQAEYEKELRQWDPERTLGLSTELLKREMDKSSDRKQYRHVAA